MKHNHRIIGSTVQSCQGNSSITRELQDFPKSVYIPLDEASYLFQTCQQSCTLTTNLCFFITDDQVTINNVFAHRAWKETTHGPVWSRDHILTNPIVELAYIQLLCSNSCYQISLIRRCCYYFYFISFFLLFVSGYYLSAAFISLESQQIAAMAEISTCGRYS